jgi:hypothetical protein
VNSQGVVEVMRQGRWEHEEAEVETGQEEDGDHEEKYVGEDVTAAEVMGAYLKKPGGVGGGQAAL